MYIIVFFSTYKNYFQCILDTPDSLMEHLKWSCLALICHRVSFECGLNKRIDCKAIAFDEFVSTFKLHIESGNCALSWLNGKPYGS